MQLTNPKNGELLESPFATDDDASRALHALNGAKPGFAYDMITAHERGRASASQRFWLHKLAMPKPVPVASEVVDLSAVNALLARAASKLKRPAVVLALEGGEEMKVSVAGGASRYTGQVMMSAPVFGGKYYGRVDQAGGYFAGRDATPASLNLLKRFAADPLKVAAEHGHLTGKCCFCNRALKDDKSTALGYGPVCAKKWGLAHDVKAARAVAILA